MASATPMPSGTIFNSARTCLELFRVCQAAEGALSVLQPYQQRYWAWANSLKVFAKPHISLDAQLKANKFVQLRQAIVLLLNILWDNLKLALKLSQDETLEFPQCGDSSSVPANGASTMHPLKVPLSGVEGSLKRLDRIAVIILQATESSLARRILAHAEQVRDQPYEEHVDRVLRYRFQEALPTELRKLIRNSILHRYYRIQYERDCRTREAPRWEAPQQAPKSNAERPAEPSRPPKLTSAKEPEELTEQHLETRSEVKTTPLTVDENVVKEELKEGLSSPSRKNVDTASVSETGDALYPKAPNIKEGQTKAMCPICLKDYEVDVFEGLKWRAHVDADLQPYVCISEDCSTNLRFFADRRSWSSHMQKTHTALWIRYLHNDRVWICALPHKNVVMFSTEEELLEKHMQAEHSELAASTLRNMAHHGGVPQVRHIDKCPICGDEHRPQKRLEDTHENHDRESESDDESAAKGTAKAIAKPSVRFALTEEQTQQFTNPIVEDPADRPSPEANTHKRLERYIGKHLKALAFYFARNLIAEDDDEKTSAAQARSMDSLETVDLKDLQDPPKQRSMPRAPSAITIENRAAGEAVLSRLSQFREYAGVNFPNLSSFTTWLATYGNAEHLSYESWADGPHLSYNEWALSEHVLRPYLNHLNVDPDWEPSAVNNPSEEEKEWLQRVYATRPRDYLQEDVEVWRGIAPNTAYAVAADILLALELCWKRNLDEHSPESSAMDQGFAGLHQMIQRRVAMIEGPVESTQNPNPISDHTKALKKFATDLADVAEDLAKKRSMWLELSGGPTNEYTQLEEMIHSRIKAVRDGLQLHVVLAILNTRTEMDFDHSLDRDFEWSEQEKTVLETFFKPTPTNLRTTQTVKNQVDAIIRTLKAQSDPIPTSNAEALWIVPFQRNPRFVGRNAEIAQVDGMLSRGIRCERAAIVGLGGVGKTQIALEFTYQLRERQPDCSVFWIPVMNVESMLEAYRNIGEQLQIPNVEQEKADIQKLVQRRLSQESFGKWLLVFDNADNIDIWTDEADMTVSSGHRIDDLPKSKHGSILFTTRNQKEATRLAGKNVVLVGEMDEIVAMDLFKESLVDPIVLADSGAAANLLQKLTNLPLAIVHAAAYINENDISLAEYTAILDDTEQNMTDLLSGEFEDEGRYGGVKNPVATTWLISFEQMRRHNQLAAEYLSFMSCVDAKDIPQSLFPPAQSAKEATDAIGTLSAYSFITKHKTDQLLDLHRLVHLATRNWLRMEGSLEVWASKALERLEEVFPDSDHTNRSVWRMYFPHARYALESELGGAGNRNTRLLWRFGKCAHSDGRYTEAERAFAQVMQVQKRALGAEHPSTLRSMGHLASIYRDQGRWEEAEELEVQVVEKSEKKLGTDHPDTLTSMGNLASTYRNQGRWKEAEELEVQVVEKSEKKLGTDHPDTLTSMGNLASTYRNQGRWKEAEELEVQVVETSEKKLGAEHPATLTSMGNLASTYRNQGRWKEAEELEVKVMEIRKSVLGAEHPDTLTGMDNLASTYGNQGRWNEAEELEVKVMETFKRELGEGHPSTLTSMANLASTYQNQGRWKQAEELEIKVMESCKRVFGAEHPDTLTSMNNLAITWKGNGRDVEALSLMKECIELRVRILGVDHPHSLYSCSALAVWETAQADISTLV